MPRDYRIYDVFTDTRLSGNALAIVLGAEGLDDAAMQAIAREFNLSETIFFFPAAAEAHAARVRIFTPAQELPFAGHPTVGAAICLARERHGAAAVLDALVVLEEAVGPVRCGVRLAADADFAEFDCPVLPERLGEAPPKDAIAAAIDLAPAAIGLENHQPGVWSAGVPYVLVPIHSMGALADAAPAEPGWQAALAGKAAYLYTRHSGGSGHAFRARMFAPGLGITEDPATGSAAAALAGAIHVFDAPPDGEHSLVIEQGVEMGRPSLIRLGLTVEGRALTGARVGGHAVEVARGTLMV